MPKSENSISRRKFAKQSSAGVAAAVAMSSIGRNAWAAGGDQIKIGLIGCGNRGPGAAMNALDADPGVKLVAMADLFSDRLESALAKIKAHCPERTQVDADHRFVGDSRVAQMANEQVPVRRREPDDELLDDLSVVAAVS